MLPSVDITSEFDIRIFGVSSVWVRLLLGIPKVLRVPAYRNLLTHIAGSFPRDRQDVCVKDTVATCGLKRVLVVVLVVTTLY